MGLSLRPRLPYLPHHELSSRLQDLACPLQLLAVGRAAAGGVHTLRPLEAETLLSMVVVAIVVVEVGVADQAIDPSLHRHLDLGRIGKACHRQDLGRYVAAIKARPEARPARALYTQVRQPSSLEIE